MHKVIKRAIKVKDKLFSAQKVVNGLISILNIGATGYSIFTVVEPFLDKKKEVK